MEIKWEEPVERNVVMTLSRDQVLNIWAALGTSCVETRKAYLRNKGVRLLHSDVDSGYRAFDAIDDWAERNCRE